MRGPVRSASAFMYPSVMSGSASKRPRPSYEEGKTRDPEIERLQGQVADQGSKGQKDRLVEMIKRSVQKA